ncbi:MAG: hypothetical protein DRR42_06160 [Gammaproteobacteria bacterium]|nr:MAG: hypothetical protein DRR42_06160 [Gammaproteobacteria bacterium]
MSLLLGEEGEAGEIPASGQASEVGAHLNGSSGDAATGSGHGTADPRATATVATTERHPAVVQRDSTARAVAGTPHADRTRGGATVADVDVTTATWAAFPKADDPGLVADGGARLRQFYVFDRVEVLGGRAETDQCRCRQSDNFPHGEISLC